MWMCNYITIWFEKVAMWFEVLSQVSTIWIPRLFEYFFLNLKLHTKHVHWMILKTYILHFYLSIVILKTPFNFLDIFCATWPFTNMRSKTFFHVPFLETTFLSKWYSGFLSKWTRSTYPIYLLYVKYLGTSLRYLLASILSHSCTITNQW